MKKYFIFLCLLGIITTSCDLIEDIATDLLGGSEEPTPEVTDPTPEFAELTIKYDYSGAMDYRDLKVTFGEETYTAIGKYDVPFNTVVNISWSIYGANWQTAGTWEKHSKDVRVGDENMTIIICGREINIE